jgi:hypothetical protein
VVFIVAGRLVAGSGSCGRVLDVVVATATSAIGGRYQCGDGDEGGEQVQDLDEAERGPDTAKAASWSGSSGATRPMMAAGLGQQRGSNQGV